MATGILSVSEVNSYIKNMFTQDFLLNRLSVKGEISNCKYHTSGHIYFTIKDAFGTLAAVMFAGNRKGLSFKLENGQQVIVTGSVSIYERDGKYQMYANHIELQGMGDLYQRYEKLKSELEEMGMFDASYKQPIPRYASKIGIVTAKTGAAIQDILNISHRRNPYVQLYLYPAIVQGENAARSIVNGIQTLDEMNLDIIIVGRGGGSIEDLWAFNEEIVARAIFNAATPIISAVGHETDFTIADFVSDLRAPTPSAAAELAVYDQYDIENQIRTFEIAFRKNMKRVVTDKRMLLERISLQMGYHHPSNVLAERKQHLTDLSEGMRKALSDTILKNRHRLSIYSEKLNGMSPLLKLSQGYSYAQDESGAAITDIKKVQPNDLIDLYVKNGVIHSKVLSLQENDFFDK